MACCCSSASPSDTCSARPLGLAVRGRAARPAELLRAGILVLAPGTGHTERLPIPDRERPARHSVTAPGSRQSSASRPSRGARQPDPTATRPRAPDGLLERQSPPDCGEPGAFSGGLRGQKTPPPGSDLGGDLGEPLRREQGPHLEGARLPAPDPRHGPQSSEDPGPRRVDGEGLPVVRLDLPEPAWDDGASLGVSDDAVAERLGQCLQVEHGGSGSDGWTTSLAAPEIPRVPPAREAHAGGMPTRGGGRNLSRIVARPTSFCLGLHSRALQVAED